MKDAIRVKFVAPLKKQSKTVEQGKPFPDDVKMSMLMFGPPGTSKTSLAKDIAKVLGWPLLEVDPSHILVDGWDRVHATAIRLLDDLAELDCAVVLLDEFDELVRTREGEKGEPVSRFFTTAMLPKLIKLNKERRIVLLMATNFVDQFDDAIIREGRFETVVQVLPPTIDAKIAEWPNIAKLSSIPQFDFHDIVNDFTYHEAKRFADAVADITDREEAKAVLKRFQEKATMLRDGEKWKNESKLQRSQIRI